MVITPICPHSLSPRSIVVSAEDTIKWSLVRAKRHRRQKQSRPSMAARWLTSGRMIVILMKRAKYNTQLIKLDNTEFMRYSGLSLRRMETKYLNDGKKGWERMMKISRQSKIIELINKYDIETQEELADR
jgi:hypothetical protein